MTQVFPLSIYASVDVYSHITILIKMKGETFFLSLSWSHYQYEKAKTRKKFSIIQKVINPKAPIASQTICKIDTIPIPRIYIHTKLVTNIMIMLVTSDEQIGMIMQGKPCI